MLVTDQLLRYVGLIFNGQMVHHFPLREVRDEAEEEINFNVLGKKGNIYTGRLQFDIWFVTN